MRYRIPISHTDIVIVACLIIVLYSGGMTHYATGKKEYGLDNKNKDIILFNSNPLFNDFSI